MLSSIRFETMAKVIESWEASRQKLGSVGAIGTIIMLHFFKRAPDAKAIYGFNIEDQSIEFNPLLRKRILMHGAAMFEFLDSVFNLLGPDTDIIAQIMTGLGKRHEKHGVKKEHFPLLGLAVCDALAEIMVESWTQTMEDAWMEVFYELSFIITQEMD